MLDSDAKINIFLNIYTSYITKNVQNSLRIPTCQEHVFDCYVVYRRQRLPIADLFDVSIMPRNKVKAKEPTCMGHSSPKSLTHLQRSLAFQSSKNLHKLAIHKVVDAKGHKCTTHTFVMT